MRRPTRRERILLLVALIVAVAVGWWTFRYRPLAKELEIVRRGLADAEARIAHVQWPRVEGDEGSLERDLATLRTVNQEAGATLAEMERRFVSLAKPETLEDLRVQMSARAADCQVRFRENTLCPPTRLREFVGGAQAPKTSAARLVSFLTLGEPYALPVRELVFDASFCGLCSLLEGLSALPGEVVVLRFEMEAKEDDAAGPTPLSVRLLLVY